MTPLSLTDEQRLVLLYSPHLKRLLDALNPQGALQVLDLKLNRSTTDVLQIECRLDGLNPNEALTWAHGHSQAPMLRVHAPTARLRTCTLWFGKMEFEGLAAAYLRLEVPVQSSDLSSANFAGEDESFLVLTSHTDASRLAAWAKEERERLAEESVTQYLEPVLLQSESFGVEAIALGVRAALLKLPPARATDLLARTVPVLMTAWALAWRESIAERAPGLRRVEAELVSEYTEGLVQAQMDQMDAFHAAPAVNRMRLFGSAVEPLRVWCDQSAPHWEEEEEEFQRLRTLTGAAFPSGEEAVAFLEELEAFVLIYFQAHSTTRIDWPAASTPEALLPSSRD
jgi:hypothetical protein